MMELKKLSKEEILSLSDEFCELYRRCFTAEINKDIVIGRFISNPLSDLFMCVAMDNGRIVANISASPSRVMFKGKSYKAALSLNTMTDPNYRGKGLMVSLTSMLYEYLREFDYKLLYGFPNYISNVILCSRLGRKVVYEIPTLELETTNLEMPVPTDVVAVDNGDSLFLPHVDEIHIGKNTDYLNWRYTNHPNNKYYFIKGSKGGWAIYKYYQNMINIVEFHAMDKSEQLSLISYISNETKINGAEKMTVWSKSNTEEHLIFESLGFRNKYPITYFSILDLGLGDKVDVDIYDYRNWNVNMGDDYVY